MKKFLFFLLLLPFISRGQNTQGFDIIGTITGLPDGADVKLMNANDNSKIASAKILKGKFELKGKVAEPVLCLLSVGTEKPEYIFIENKKITITGTKTKLRDMKVAGSPSHKDFLEFRKVFDPLMNSLNAAVNILNMTPRGAQFDAVMKTYDSLHTVGQNEIDKFITARPKSYVSPFVLYVTMQMNDDPVLLEKRFNALDSSIKNSVIGKNLYSYIQYNKIGAVGTMAVDFTQPDTTGKPVSLSSFRGKYVLVDFWASWCGPCRAENPNVVQNYNAFKEKNFTVLGVSLDKPGGRENWLGAIHRDGLTWTHVSDLQFWNNAAAQLYHVQQIPFNMLIDPTGKIVAKDLRGEQLHSKLCELLGCN